MIEIYGNRTEFYQWDLNQKLIIDPALDCAKINIGNAYSKKFLVVEIREEDGLRVCDVPNILLQEPHDILVYAICKTIGERVIYKQKFKLITREKPSDYIYEETEVRTWEELDYRLDWLEALDHPVPITNAEIESIIGGSNG